MTKKDSGVKLKPLEASSYKQVKPHHSLFLFCLLGEKFKQFNERITILQLYCKRLIDIFLLGGWTIRIWPRIPYCYWCCDQQSKSCLKVRQTLQHKLHELIYVNSQRNSCIWHLNSEKKGRSFRSLECVRSLKLY